MIKILANDGLGGAGATKIHEAGFDLTMEKIPQASLGQFLQDHHYQGLIVRSATQVTPEIIDQARDLRFIGRAGVGMDNIDIPYAKAKGITVMNTPAASTNAVAELVFAHLFTSMRNLHNTNQRMPQGDDFKILKKASATGQELRGKTLGIWGFGRIGQEVAKKALAFDMQVLAYDPFLERVELQWSVGKTTAVSVPITTISLDQLLSQSDIITFHVPKPAQPIVTAQEITQMKNGVVVINTSRGEVFDETALIEALMTEKIARAGMDVFQNEPTPNLDLIRLPNVSVSPHIGGETQEAQGRISLEMADNIIQFFKDAR